MYTAFFSLYTNFAPPARIFPLISVLRLDKMIQDKHFLVLRSVSVRCSLFLKRSYSFKSDFYRNRGLFKIAPLIGKLYIITGCVLSTVVPQKYCLFDHLTPAKRNEGNFHNQHKNNGQKCVGFIVIKEL